VPRADDAEEFVLNLHHGRGGAPSGTLRAVGEPNERPFEGWIGLIGLITELGYTAGESNSESEVRGDRR
jgi:hypothetical protein